MVVLLLVHLLDPPHVVADGENVQNGAFLQIEAFLDLVAVENDVAADGDRAQRGFFGHLEHQHDPVRSLLGLDLDVVEIPHAVDRLEVFGQILGKVDIAGLGLDQSADRVRLDALVALDHHLDDLLALENGQAHVLRQFFHHAGQVFDAFSHGREHLGRTVPRGGEQVHVEAEVLADPGEASPDQVVGAGLHGQAGQFGMGGCRLAPAARRGVVQNARVGALLRELLLHRRRQFALQIRQFRRRVDLKGHDDDAHCLRLGRGLGGQKRRMNQDHQRKPRWRSERCGGLESFSYVVAGANLM